MNSAHDRTSATLALDEPVERVRLVSPARARVLHDMGVFTVRDLVCRFPRRYIDLSVSETILSARIGEQCTIAGTIHEIKLKRPKPKLPLVEITLVDGTSTLMVTAFRQPWLMDSLSAGMRIAVAGKLEFDYGFKRMTNPFIEVLDGQEGELGAGMIIPVHPASEKLSAAMVRRLVINALELVEGCLDPIPLDLRCRWRLMSRACAYECVHFPKSMAEAKAARRRLAYEEVLLLELSVLSEDRALRDAKAAVSHCIDGAHVRALAAALPFALTDEQAAARDDILRSLARDRVSSHMLLGDVGTGKTVVAAHALAAAADTGAQALLMAPTEVLARQHYKSLGALFEAADVTCAVLCGSTPADERAFILAQFAEGDLDVLIGTHALLEDDVVPRNLSLVVIDEQQRFGVEQRSRLLEKRSIADGGRTPRTPDALYLTATPIPRSLALALFGNLTLSYIKKRPFETAPRKTHVVRKQDRGKAYDAALAALKRGEQVYVVCPLVGKDGAERDKVAAGKRQGAEDDETLHPAVSIECDDDFANDNVSAATKEARILQETVFIDYRVELLHGKMSSSDKEAVMERFRTGETHVLVATTVIEVGVDVPNATVMIVEDADRFGLSQLHQLRGRVGRGDKPGEVYLVSAARNDVAVERLRAMEKTDDGYELAAYDLSLRREGDILGNRQSGASVLKLVNVVRDGKLIETAHADAVALLEEDPRLDRPEHRALAREMRLLFKGGKSVQGG